MEKDAFERSLRALVKRVPFRPFTVELINGEKIEVEHPEALVIRGGVAIFFRQDLEMNLFDHQGVNRFTFAQDQAATT